MSDPGRGRAPNRGFVYRARVGPDDDGRTVLDHLARRWPHGDAALWRHRIEAGLVRVEGDAVGVDRLLRAGESLAWHRPPWVEPPAPDGPEVLARDDDVVVVSKPSGLPTLPGAGFLEATVLHRVRARFPEARPMHRLGRFTSGVLVLARTPGAQRRLAAAFREGRVHKRYRALLAGIPARDRFEIDAPIGPVPYPPLGTIHAATPDGRPSRSAFTVLERRDRATLVDVVIPTGRPHQIRIHAAAAGHPLEGDPLYAAGGRPAPGCTALPGDPGYLLHAAEIRFPAPDGTLRTVLAPPPAALLTAAERERGAGSGVEPDDPEP